MANQLFEYIAYDTAKVVLEKQDVAGNKVLYLEGIFIQGDVKNQNLRVYPLREITSAVTQLNERIHKSESILGELDHPEELSINLDRVSHMITSMWMEGNNGCGKLKLLPTPCGNIAISLLDNGVKLGVSSRGSGDVDSYGNVSDFSIVTVDIVAQPSAPEAFPKKIYESLFNMRGGARIHRTAVDYTHDPKAKKQLDKDIIQFIKELKLK